MTPSFADRLGLEKELKVTCLHILIHFQTLRNVSVSNVFNFIWYEYSSGARGSYPCQQYKRLSATTFKKFGTHLNNQILDSPAKKHLLAH